MGELEPGAAWQPLLEPSCPEPYVPTSFRVDLSELVTNSTSSVLASFSLLRS